jgi:hypothetical protein
MIHEGLNMPTSAQGTAHLLKILVARMNPEVPADQRVQEAPIILAIASIIAVDQDSLDHQDSQDQDSQYQDFLDHDFLDPLVRAFPGQEIQK